MYLPQPCHLVNVSKIQYRYRYVTLYYIKKIVFASKWHQLDTNLRRGKRSERIEHVAIKFKIHKNIITTHTTLCHSLSWWAMYRIFSSVEYLEVPLHYLGSAMYIRYITDTENGSIFEYLPYCISDTPQPCIRVCNDLAQRQKRTTLLPSLSCGRAIHASYHHTCTAASPSRHLTLRGQWTDLSDITTPEKMIMNLTEKGKNA